jgi:hypothetical protein
MWNVEAELDYRQQCYAMTRQQANEERLIRQIRSTQQPPLWSRILHVMSLWFLKWGHALERRVLLINSRTCL